MYKQGLNDVVTTVLIVLVSITSIGIVWTFIGAYMENNSEIIESNVASQVRMDIKTSSVSIVPNVGATMTVERLAGEGEVPAFTVVLEDSTGKTYTQTIEQTINELESKRVTVYSGNKIGNIAKISVVPKIINPKGKTVYANSMSHEILPVSDNTRTGMDGLAGYWGFNDNFKDDSGNGNDGTPYNIPASPFVEGKVGKSINFDGINDYIQIPATQVLEMSGLSFSMSVWVKSSANYPTATERLIFEHNVWGVAAPNSYQITSLNPSSLTLRFNTMNGWPVDYIVNFNDGSWHHIVSTFKRIDNTVGVGKIYYDGVEVVNLGTTYCSLTPGFSPSYIGSRAGTSYFFQGNIDEIMIFNRTLSAEEVKAIYDSSK